MRHRWAWTFVALLFLIPAGFVYALVDINTASVSELQTLTGIGEVKAQSIIEYRNTNGPFKSIEEIKNVSGIGDATYEKIRNDITVGAVSDPDPEDDSGPEEEEEGRENATSSSSPAETFVYADIQVPTTRVVAGMSVRFEGFEGAALREHKPSYKWNMGDGSTKRGSVVRYTYMQPGTYVVSVQVERYSKIETDEIVMTVVPAGVSISNVVPGSDGFVEVQNDTKVKIDVSGWTLRNSIDRFIFPEKSYIAPNATLRLTHDVLQLESVSHIDLVDVEGSVVDSYPGSVEVIPESFYQKSASSGVTPVATQRASSEEDEQEVEQFAAAGLTAGPPEDDGVPVWTWLLAVLGIVVVASGTLFVMPTNKRNSSAEVVSVDDIEIIE